MSFAAPAWLSLVIVVLASAAPVSAQSSRPERPTRPVRGLLGNGGVTSLGASFFVFGGHDKSTFERRAGDIEGPERQGDATNTGISANLTLGRPVKSYAMTASGGGDFRYYFDNGDIPGVRATSGYATLGLGGPLGRRATLRVAQTFSAASFYQFNPFSGYGPASPSDLALPSADYRLAKGRTYSYALSSGLMVPLSRRNVLRFDYHFRFVDFPVETVRLRTQGIGARFERRLTQQVSLRLGYGYDRGESGQGVAPSDYHRLDAGFGFQGPLPFSEGTTLSVSTGAAVVTEGDERTGTRNVPLLVASATLDRSLGRSWSLQGGYRREPRFVELYQDPTYADVAFVVLNGSPWRPIGVAVQGGYSRTLVDLARRGVFPTGEQATESVFATSRLSFRLSRWFSPFVDYAYYTFTSRVATPAIGASSRIGRHSVRVGLGWSLPLLQPRPQP